MSADNRITARDTAQQARTELAATLDALEDKLNVPKQLELKRRACAAKVRAFVDEQPVVAYTVGAAVVAAAGAAVWFVVKRLTD